MAEMQKIVLQLSDCHLFADKHQFWHGICPYDTLSRLIEVLKKSIQPDLLLLTGDIADQGDLMAYQHVHALLDTWGIPVYALPGNHDDLSNLTEVFRFESTLSLGHWCILCLDSCIPGSANGLLSDQSLNWLKDRLSMLQDQWVVLAMHHPPIRGNVPCMYPFILNSDNAERLFDLLACYIQVKALVFGHLHSECHEVVRNIPCWGAPATSRQLLAGASSIQWDETLTPACQVLKLAPTGDVERSIIRL